ncbi:hypothetical protein S40285_01146 [Stachybotrys chlorohalonatus IBT 40285]|uniref:SWR1-complex protein 5 n=1 Tax=Stachybotrys chlorohalonatus (strain IBT 40285) TaxID=1283841 RepID=A0A084QXX6_STAC4|nr:hypothetical protein S40285_01146 [Stachybotrys chlorohalonata IBT 40285]
MLSEHHEGDDEQYASSQDSDFAPEVASAADTDTSDSEDDGVKLKQGKRTAGADTNTKDASYDNSGDEAIIEKGKRRRKKHKVGVEDKDDEGGEGGLIKTRRQRAAEKEERRAVTSTGPVTVDVDAIWAKMVAGQPIAIDATGPTTDEAVDGVSDIQTEKQLAPQTTPETVLADGEEPGMIRIKRTYNFAGRVNTEEKLVPRDSAEAKLFLATVGQDAPTETAPAKRNTKKAFRSAFEPIADPIPQRADLNLGMAARQKAGREAQATKLNTVEKSRMDWAGYVDREGIKDELEMAGKSKESYAARQDFLARSEARIDEDSRRVRLAGRP